ncbi:MAG: hypothetical protein IKB51_06125, partial [Clostridia bacterium]|nr:hypothetical protein [Clostridia bacterium]
MRKITRITSLVLMLIMLVSVMGTSIFAADSTENTEQSEVFCKAPTAAEIIEDLYPKDSKYWVPVYELFNSEGTYNSAYKPVYSDYLGIGSSNVIGAPANATFANGEMLMINTDSSITTEYVFGLCNVCGNNASNFLSRIAKKNLGGLDFAITMDIKANGSSEQTHSEQTVRLNMQYYGNGSIDTMFRKGNDLYMKDGTTKIGTLSTEKFTKVTLLFDVGGATAGTCGNTIYYFIDGVCVGATDFLSEAAIATIYNNSAQYWPDNEPGYGLTRWYLTYKGYDETGFTFKSFNTYYFDDTPDDSNVSNATRGAGLVYYNDFDGVTSDSWYDDTGIAAEVSASEFPGIGSFKKSTDDLKFVSNKEMGGVALQLTEKPDGSNNDSTYFEINMPTGETRNDGGVTTGKTLIVSFDVNPDDGEVANTLLTAIEREASSTLFKGILYLESDGTLKATDTNGAELCKLPLNEFTNITVKLCQSSAVNKFYVYVDGVCVNPDGSTLLTEEELATLTYDADGNSVADGTSFDQIRFFQTKTAMNGITFDNVAVYYAEEPAVGDHDDSGVWQTDENNHWKLCAVCGIKINEETHAFDDEADECNVCGYTKGHEHDYTVQKFDDNEHWMECECGTIKEDSVASHTGGEATCTEQATCSVCNEKYGPLAPHTPGEDDGDCTTDILCSVCGGVAIEG